MLHKRPSVSSLIIAFVLFGQVTFAPAAERPCRADIQKFCADVARGGGRVAECLRQHRSELSPECKARGQELHERVQEAHQACKEDISKYCKDIGPGRGRVVTCLKEHDANLSSDCKAAMKPRRQNRGPKVMFDTPFTNINDQGVLGVFGKQESKKIVQTIEQINRNADVA